MARSLNAENFSVEEKDTFLAPPFKHDRTTLERLEKFVSKQFFLDHNLRGRLYGEEVQLEFAHVNFGQKRVTFEEARQAFENLAGKNGPKVTSGYSFGPTWATEWFCLEFRIPAAWNCHRVHLVWDSECEATLWSRDGTPLVGLSSEVNRTDYCLTEGNSAENSTKFEFYVEAAANTPFGAGRTDCISPPDPERRCTIKSAKIAVFRDDVYQLLIDFDVLIGLVKNLRSEDHLKYETLYFANDILNKFIADSSPDSVMRLHSRILRFLSAENSSSNFVGQNLQHFSQNSKNFTIHAIGNCHIDTAWLWPFDETKRKCARSWSSTISLMDEYRDLTFACSQAQQLLWVKQYYPKLFDKIREKAKHGKFVLVGGCWVEMDGNLPGGESFVRQMLYGQQFFLENFGSRCTEFWLPDTFGYSAQLPQLMIQAGMNRFLTQKMSWNLVNKFPHSTFWWRGIDGTKVLTHFPPADTYCCRVNADELTKSVSNFSDKGRSKHSVILYGHGDGGGGPDRDMLERLRRFKNAFNGITVRPSTPAEFFESVERTDLRNLCTWDGELYLELHNGTYTTHADMKSANRTCEFLLRDCEFAAVIDYLSQRPGGDLQFSPRNFADEWKRVLLNQFHDVLPGTSIGLVYQDARKIHSDVIETCKKYLLGDSEQNPPSGNDRYFLLNSLPWTRTTLLDNELYEISAMSIRRKEECKISPEILNSEAYAKRRVTVESIDGSFVMRNEYLAATVDAQGHVTNLRLIKDESGSADSTFFDFIDQNSRLGNGLAIFDDVPLYWDAWDVMDYHVETRHVIVECLEPPKIVEKSPYSVAVEFSKRISDKSTLKQRISLRFGEPYLRFTTQVDWHESHKMLKVEFPLNVRCSTATYEIQFGHMTRPTHRNTTWDAAKFEVCAQKWADLSDFGRGLALMNQSKYGYSCHDNILTLSLLRSPKSPDAEADMGRHEFTYAVMPHSGPFQAPDYTTSLNVVQCSYDLNDPVRLCKARPRWSNSVWSGKTVFHVTNKAIMVEAVKMSENGSGVIVRLYESYGSKANARLIFGSPVRQAFACNLLEDLGESINIQKNHGDYDDTYFIELSFNQFQIRSIFLTVDF